MTIRITGMNSGLDTEAIITELASARSVKVQNIQKEQTKLSWKIDAWKELNTKIYSFYTDVLSDMRFDSAYSKKSTKISNPNAVSVVTGGAAVNGVQSLKIKQLAKAAYLTGGAVKLADPKGGKVTAKTHLSDLDDSLTGDIKIKLQVGDGEEKELTFSGDSTMSEIADAISKEGLNARFDEATGRFFISAKETGAAGNFKISAVDGDTGSELALSKLGL